MMIDRLDLVNLLALHALVEERHVTRAAKRMGITQSSMSHRLASLRKTFGDPLFVRGGGILVPTPRAEAIAEPLATALRTLEQAVRGAGAFDPAHARFITALALPDPLMSFAHRFVDVLRRSAPHATVRLTSVPADLGAWLASTPGSIAIAPVDFGGPSVIVRPLGRLRFAVVGRRGHPALGARLTTARWIAYPHVVVRIGNGRPNPIEDAIARAGVARFVGFEAPSFLAGLLALRNGDLLMNAPTPIVDDVVGMLDLVVRDAPIPLPQVRLGLLFHERHKNDPAHRFARERIVAEIGPLFARPNRIARPTSVGRPRGPT